MSAPLSPLDPPSALDRWLKIPRLADERQRYFAPLIEINRAHVVMLAEQDLLEQPSAATLLRALDRIRRDPSLIERHADREDLYLMLEAAVIAGAGDEVGGRLHTGRSRNDITATMTRMVTRQKGWELGRILLALARDLLILADAHRESVMPGYTHLRPAQPTTLGHYLTGVAWALRRDFERLSQALDRANECPMGAAALAGTGFPIDRDRTAGLLGFARPARHTLDAVASRDYVLEFLSIQSILAMTLARFIQDLYVWSTYEFGFLRLDPEIAGVSSIMPQKRNPVVLERCRAKAAHITAALLDALMVQKGTGFMHSQDISLDGVAPAWVATEELHAMLDVLRAVLPSLHVNVARLQQSSGSGFALATEVADALVRSHGLSFRTAHSLVSQVADELGASVSGDAIAAALNQSAADLLKTPLDLRPEEVDRWLNPTRSVHEKRTFGGPAPDEVRRMLKELDLWHRDATDAVEKEDRHQRLARAALDEAVRHLLTDDQSLERGTTTTQGGTDS